MTYDKIILGAGIYGLYAALKCGEKGEHVLVLEYDTKPFSRATYVNQARVHSGYHYPRSMSTAMKSAGYFQRFVKDFEFCINKEFKKIYATSSEFSWTNAVQFKRFCEVSEIPCEELDPNKFFKKGMVDGAFLSLEYSYDAIILRDYFLSEIAKYKNVDIKYGVHVNAIENDYQKYILKTDSMEFYSSSFVLNATYASANQIMNLLGYEKFRMKYELCEIILVSVSHELEEYGITVMDGPFFSIMPFGKTGVHSITSVTFTPHIASYEALPTFSCQQKTDGYCSSEQLGNCNYCRQKPETAFPYMAGLARKYLRDNYSFEYKNSLFSMKPILIQSELDDSRPTLVRVYSDKPRFISVLSGKINTIYDLDEVLDYE